MMSVIGPVQSRYREMSWEVDEEVNRDKNGEADGMNLEVDSKDKMMHI